MKTTKHDDCVEVNWSTGHIPTPELHAILFVDPKNGNEPMEYRYWKHPLLDALAPEWRCPKAERGLREGDMVEGRWYIERTPPKKDQIYGIGDRELMLQHMKTVAAAFYPAACRTGCHAFIEFTGMMNEYIKLCRAAHEQGIDFNTTNVHTGRALPMKDYMAEYLGEKVGCIYGTSLSDPELFMAFVNQLELPFEVTVDGTAQAEAWDDGYKKGLDVGHDQAKGNTTIFPKNPHRKLSDAALNDKFRELVRQAKERFDALSPEEQRQHRKEQARSFVRGNLELSGIKFDEQAFEDVYERNHT